MSELPMGTIMAWWTERDPDRAAVTEGERTVTRVELDRHTNRLARAYAELGVGQDSFVTIALPNGVEFYEAALAVWKLGATPQPISSRLPHAERDAIVQLARPALVVGVTDGEHTSVASVPPGFEPRAALSDAPLAPRIAKAWKAPTSGGSTGRPKLIVAARPSTTDPLVPTLRMRVEGVHLMPGPLYHNAPFSFSTSALFRGCHVVVMPRFDAEQALALIERHRVDWTMMVPTMMQRIWRLPETVRARYDLSSLTVLLHLAAPCPPWLKRAWIDWLGPERIHELYAGTEAQVATWITGDEWLARPGSVGKPMSGRIKILDPEGKEVGPDQMGEVYMMPAKGPGTTYRYVGASARSRDGWESLGDMGRVDADGFLYLVDRQTDMILCGGSNIYPAEVEAALDAHPAVQSSAVIGLPDDDLGQRVHAIVEVREAVGDEALLAHLGERLARYKHPRSFERVSEPLRDEAGKVRRMALRQARVST